jgi:hypothetical protein
MILEKSMDTKIIEILEKCVVFFENYINSGLALKYRFLKVYIYVLFSYTLF